MSLAPPLFAEDKTEDSADYQPGELNPVMNPNRWTLFRDDELVVLTENLDEDTNNLETTVLDPTSANLESWDVGTHTDSITHRHKTCGYDYPRMSVDYGRVTRPDKDQIVRAYIHPFTDTHTRIQIDILDEDHTVINSMVDELEEYGQDCMWVNVKVADINLKVDEDGVYHDEIILFKTLYYPYEDRYRTFIQAYDKDFKEVVDGWESSFFSDYAPNWQRMEVGDFNGDGNMDAAVIIYHQNGEVTITGYQLNKYIVVKGEQYSFQYFGDGFDTAAGDFNGDGKDDLLVKTDSLMLFSADTDINWTYHGVGGQPTNNHIDNRVVSGLFYMDPEKGYGINRRQFAVIDCISSEAGSFNSFIEVNFYKVKDNWDVEPMDPRYFIFIRSDVDGVEFRYYEGSAGNFVGHMDDNTNPTMQLAVSYQELHPPEYSGGILIHPSSATLKTAIIQLDDDHTPNIVHTYSGRTYNGRGCSDWASCLPHVNSIPLAIDRDGDTYRLGAPVHIRVDDFFSIDTLLQEPPKHVDYLPSDHSDWDGEWKVINVNAYPAFYVGLDYENESSMSTETISTSSHDIGGSTAISASSSIGANAAIASGAVTAGVGFKIGYDYEEEEESYNSKYETRETMLSYKTNNDDVLETVTKPLHIWRYRVYGAKTDDQKNVFQEIIMPGYETSRLGFGKGHYDVYQPKHVNRNLLFYPDAIDFPSKSDIGTFTLPDGTEVTNTMTPNELYDYDGNDYSTGVKWTKEAGEGKSKSYKHTLKESIDIWIAYTCKVEGLVKESAKAKFNIHNSNSWGGKETKEISTSESTGFTINQPTTPVPSGWNFFYKPAVYVSADGGILKCTHAVDFSYFYDNSGAANWGNYYGTRPDPGLNLPNRFLFDRSTGSQFGTWELNTDDQRMEMRGFFKYLTQPNPVTGDKDPLSSNPIDGDQVELVARVYNFSLPNPDKTTVTDLVVRFEYQLYDTSAREEVPMPDGRVLIGETTIGTLDGQTMTEASVIWDTSGLSNTINPDTGELDNAIGYRIYVTLDPDNTISNEIHEWKDESEEAREKGIVDEQGRLYHGNNEGYWPKNQAIFVRTETDDSQTETFSISGLDFKSYQTAETSMHEASLAVETANGLRSSGNIILLLNRRYHLRAHLKSDHQDNDYRRMLFLDGHPDQNPGLLASVKVRGLVEDNYVWTDWTPGETGEYELWAVFNEDPDETNTLDARDALKVTVVDPDSFSGSGGSGSGGCMIETVMPK